MQVEVTVCRNSTCHCVSFPVMWLPGQIVEVTGPVSYKVRIDKDGRIFRRHQDQLRKVVLSVNKVHKLSYQH